MRLDRVRLLGFPAGGFNHVGINRALRQPFGIVDFCRFTLKSLDKLTPDDLAFGFRIGNTGKTTIKITAGIDRITLTARLPAKISIT